MRSVEKYQLLMQPVQRIHLPDRARILHLAAHDGTLALWALVDRSAAMTERVFYIFADGEVFDESAFKSDYVGSFVLDGRAGHIVEIVG